MADEPFRADLPVLRRNRALLGAALVPLFLGPLLLLFGASAHAPLFAAFGPAIFLFGLALSLYTWTKNPSPRLVDGPVEASGAGVSVGGELVIRREAIREGFVIPRGGLLHPIVRLVQKGFRSPFEVVVDNEAQGRALLRSLSLDASQTVARFRLPSRLQTNVTYRIASGIGIGVAVGLGRLLGHAGPHPGVALITIGAVLVFLLSMLFTPGRLEIGSDGLVTSWLGQKRFIGYADMKSYDRYSEGSYRNHVWGLKLVLGSGEEVKIPIGTRQVLDESKMPLILERMREAIESFKRGDATADAALLRRGARDVSGWMRHLRSIGAGANAAMRTAPIDADRLWRIVEDPSAEASARAGAAVALGGDLDAPGKQRLRAVAEAIAQPKVRVAIEAAAESADEAALAEALGQIEGEDRTARARST